MEEEIHDEEVLLEEEEEEGASSASADAQQLGVYAELFKCADAALCASDAARAVYRMSDAITDRNRPDYAAALKGDAGYVSAVAAAALPLLRCIQNQQQQHFQQYGRQLSSSSSSSSSVGVLLQHGGGIPSSVISKLTIAATAHQPLLRSLQQQQKQRHGCIDSVLLRQGGNSVLLPTIFEYLDPLQDLLRSCTRVCKYWNREIAGEIDDVLSKFDTTDSSNDEDLFDTMTNVCIAQIVGYYKAILYDKLPNGFDDYIVRALTKHFDNQKMSIKPLLRKKRRVYQLIQEYEQTKFEFLKAMDEFLELKNKFDADDTDDMNLYEDGVDDEFDRALYTDGFHTQATYDTNAKALELHDAADHYATCKMKLRRAANEYAKYKFEMNIATLKAIKAAKGARSSSKLVLFSSFFVVPYDDDDSVSLMKSKEGGGTIINDIANFLDSIDDRDRSKVLVL